MQSLLINSLKFATEKEQLGGPVAVADFVRLADTVEPNGMLDYRVTGDVDSHHRPQLHVTVQGTVKLQCRRCLGELPHDIAIDAVLWLVAEKELEARQVSEEFSDPDEPDCIAASSELDVMALLEDEILLALPSHPRHAEGKCGVGVAPAENRKSAFSALAKLQSTLHGELQSELKSELQSELKKS